MNSLDYRFEGIDELKTAIRRNPQMVKEETAKFIARGLAEYRRIISRSPWRIGGSGGGAPVGTGNLRDTHAQEQRPFEGKIYPRANYAGYVHEGTGRMQARPWLDYAKKSGNRKIRQLEKDLLATITKDLAK